MANQQKWYRPMQGFFKEMLDCTSPLPSPPPPFPSFPPPFPFHSLPSPFLPFPLPSLFRPLPSLPLEVGPLIAAMVWESALATPAGQGGARPPNGIR